MSNVSQFNSKETIQATACDWIAAIDRGLTAQETEALKKWVASNPSHQKVLAEMAALWDEISVMNTVRELAPLQNTTRPSPSRRWLISAAAVFMLTGLISWQWLSSPGEPARQVMLTEHSQTLVGEQKTVTLADGSKVYLNTDTEIHVTFYPDSRQVALLRGEAHFEVAKDPAKPFTVSAGNNAVTAVGTAFNMQFTRDKAFELTVTEGKVRVSTQLNEPASEQQPKPVIAREGVMVFAGEKVLVSDKVSPRESLTQSEIAQSLAWQDGQIVFTGEQLPQALQEISRYTQVKFVIDDDALKTTRVAGYFRVGDIKGLLAALENSFAISSYEGADKTIHLHTTSGS